MKVLYVIDTIQGSGAERSLVEIALHFQKWQPVFVHVYKGDMLRPLLEEAGITVHGLNTPDPRNFSAAAKKLREIYDLEQPDIIHSTLFRSDAITRKLRSEYHVPLISSFVNNSYSKLRFEGESLFMQLKLRLVQLYDLISARKVDFFISNSATIKKSKTKATLVNPDKVKVIYRGRDTSKFPVAHKEEELQELRRSLKVQGKRVLLNVSRLINRKGQMDLIDAMPGILKKHPETVLLIAGHGVYKEKLEKRAGDLGISEHVQLLGRRMDVPKLLAIADVFVYPSYLEGLPGALIEAMMARKIIVCSDISENLECVDSRSAIIFERANIADLVEKTTWALENQKDLKELGESARQQAEKNFDINSVARQYESTYDEFLKQFKKGS